MSFNSGDNGGKENRGRDAAPGSMIGARIAIGAGLGVAMGVALGNLALGIAIGTAIGVALGAAMEQNQGGKAARTYGAGRRPLWVVVAVGLALLGVALTALVMLVLR